MYSMEISYLFRLFQDVQYADIDHMTGFRNFELNQSHFGDLPEYFDELRDGGMKGIVILVCYK